MKVLITGAAGFIGSALTLRLLERGNEVIGIDNHNNYYDPTLKEARLSRQINHINYFHIRGDIANKTLVDNIFKTHKPNQVINLAAQSGVRYSLENPQAYIEANVLGFTNVIEACRQNNVDHFVYASSSAVYGSNTKTPFSEHQNVNHPVSLYAATKKSNELIAHSYSHLYQLSTTGLRFFTVYGPWDRPDMALQRFTKAIIQNKPLKLYNYGNHTRDFTYIDDVIEGIIRVLDKPSELNPKWCSVNPDSATSYAPWRVYNIGSNKPINLNQLIEEVENALGKKAIKKSLPLQPGDTLDTDADTTNLVNFINYKPSTKLTHGIQKFIDWYESYY